MRRRVALALVARACVAVAVQVGLLAAIGLALGLFAIGATVLALPVLWLLGGGDVGPSSLWWVPVVAVGQFVLVLGEALRREGPVARAGTRGHLVRGRPPDDDAERAAAAAVRRLAHQATVPAPAVRVADGGAPLCYTAPGEDGPVVVVSTGLLDALDDREREAVLAHEVAHLANGDYRLTAWVLLPLAVLDELTEDDREPRDRVQRLARRLADRLVPWGEVGVGVLSRGREFAADRAAARLTGDPAGLAAALRTLEDAASEPPDADLRDRASTVDALSVVPTLDPAANAGGLRATHPPTADRIERLERLAGATLDG